MVNGFKVGSGSADLGREWSFLWVKKKPDSVSYRALNLVPGDDLLSHGETPHYHRRCVISLLSSVWNQVVLTLYGRQAKKAVKFKYVF